MLFGMMAFSTTANFAGRVVFCISSILAGLILYLLLSTFLVDLLNLVQKINPLINGLLSIGITILILIYGIWNSSVLRPTEVEIPIKGLSKEIRVVHLTDIHLGHFRGKEHLKKIVAKTIELKPDIVLHTGDLFDAKSRLYQDVLTPLKEIQAPHYFVEGNHDKYVGAEEVKRLLKNINVNVLENEIATFEELQIVGLKHMLADKESFDMHASEGETIKEVLGELAIDKTKPTILLHHSPDGEEYANNLDIDLLLAGHTHGGQMFPLTLIAKLMFDYNDGLYEFKNLFIYVSEGAGTIYTPMRIGTKSEITLIKLTPKKEPKDE